MNQVYVFLIRNDVWIYVLAGIGLFWYLGQLIRARRSLRQAMFGLERERGQQQQRRALTFSMILALIVVLVSYVNVIVAPTLPSELLKPPTPTPDIFITPLSSPTPIGTQESALPQLAPTVTLVEKVGEPLDTDEESLEEPTAEPTPPAAIGECQPEVTITSPPSGAQVSGRFTIFGTAAGGNVLLYDLEIWGGSTEGRWLSILEERRPSPILDGILGSVDLIGSVDGLYTIRLSVFNSDDEVVGQCAIQVDFDSSG